jgi:phosphoglycerate dehydrogenase-like enzyme
MKILVDFPFSDEQIEQLRAVAVRNGSHELIQIQSEEEGVAAAPGVEVILGHFKKAVCEAAPNLKWMQTFAAGLDGGIIYDGLADREGVVISNMAGEYAAAAADHAPDLSHDWSRTNRLDEIVSLPHQRCPLGGEPAAKDVRVFLHEPRTVSER